MASFPCCDKRRKGTLRPGPRNFIWVHLEEDLGGDGGKIDPLARVQRDVWGILYANGAGIVYKSAPDLAKMILVIVTVSKQQASPYPEQKTTTMMLRTPNQVLRASPLVVEATGQRYICKMQSFCTMRYCHRKCRPFARDQTMDPSRKCMLHSGLAGALRNGRCPVHSKSAHAKG